VKKRILLGRDVLKKTYFLAFNVMFKREINTFKDDFYWVIELNGSVDERGNIYLRVMLISKMQKPMYNLMFRLLNSLIYKEWGKEMVKIKAQDEERIRFKLRV